MIAYMHSLRDLDPDSIGNWQRDGEKVAYIKALLDHPDYGSALRRFMNKYQYQR